MHCQAFSDLSVNYGEHAPSMQQEQAIYLLKIGQVNLLPTDLEDTNLHIIGTRSSQVSLNTRHRAQAVFFMPSNFNASTNSSGVFKRIIGGKAAISRRP